RLAEEFGIPHISTGAYFRAQLECNTELGKRIRTYMDSGSLVPDELTCEVVEARLKEPDCEGGYVLDGFPRSLPQARILDEMLAARGESLDVAIDLEVPDEEIVARLTARRTCPVCGRIFNLKFDPPSSDAGICDRTGCTGELVTRSDDTEETVRERIRIYHRTTEPIIKYYKERGLLHVVIEGDLGPDDVFAKVEEVVGRLGRA
ncbi:MAG: nucleoside monophosphate kinase, partial [Candidatus Hydrogenedentes bacterium]|nr:nucleoside monophosphate kinase [Candidatus Hydrogenedentota bacterium]